MTGPSAADPPDVGQWAATLAALAGRARASGGSRGAPEAVQTPADVYRDSLSAQVMYDAGVAFAVAFADLAGALEAAALGLALRRPDGEEPLAPAGTAAPQVPMATPSPDAPSVALARDAPAGTPPPGEQSLRWVARGPLAAREAAGKLSVQIERLDLLIRELSVAVGDPPDASPHSPADGPATLLRQALGTARAGFVGLAEALEADLAGPALASADRRCRSALSEAASLADHARRTARWATSPERQGWIEASVSSSARDRLRRSGALAGAAERLLASRWGTAGAARADVAELRRELAGQSAAELDRLARRRPDVALRWAAPSAAADLPEPLREVLGLPEADPVGRVAAVRAACHAHADQVGVWAMLWPALVGPLDGVPLTARAAANRLLLRAELERARALDVSLERHIAAQAVAARGSWRGRARWRAVTWAARGPSLTWLGYVQPHHPVAERADLRVRIRLYESLLNDPRADAAGPPGSPGSARSAEAAAVGASRAIILFDPAGRGRLAEAHGPWGPRVARVVVFVPGTGTAVRGFHLPTQVAADLTSADPAGTAALAWMGADFPQAVAGRAAWAQLASAAARPLADFVAGLDAPEDADITVIGHSFGGVVVGAAERIGLPVDAVVHLASPGAGPGVRTVADYRPARGIGGSPAIRRYAMTAPGDPVRWVPRAAAVARGASRGLSRAPGGFGSRIRRWAQGLDLGVDPHRLAGVITLDLAGPDHLGGVGRAHRPRRGPAGHAEVVAPDALRRLARLLAGAPAG